MRVCGSLSGWSRPARGPAGSRLVLVACVRVDPAACPELPGVQRRRWLEFDVHFAIGLPPLIADVVLQMFGERTGGELVVRIELLQVSRIDGDRIAVGGQ